MSRVQRALIAILIAVTASVAILFNAPAHAESSACRTFIVTARGSVALRAFAFTDTTIVGYRRAGDTIRTCGATFLGGAASRYTKCGRTGTNWLPLILPGRASNLTTQDRFGVPRAASAWFPVTCARQI